MVGDAEIPGNTRSTSLCALCGMSPNFVGHRRKREVSVGKRMSFWIAVGRLHPPQEACGGRLWGNIADCRVHTHHAASCFDSSRQGATMSDPVSSKQFYTLQEVAEILSLHPKTVARYLARGELAGVRLSDSARAPWRVRSDWLDKWAEDNIYNPRGSRKGRRGR
jgi:excisionase family DNA binding protein